ncbi:MAG TPA: ribosome biogenesis GTPase Der [Candidatus Eisenbacteria bacterium]|nr:ribosome biogenesis GTPase Der [Candidatus Eisenbacteria bacterium]
MSTKMPSLVIVGRPNVGKSTLFNRLTGTRRSIVTNEPGITRDRIYGKAEWRGRELEIVDTGGIIPDDKALIPQEILRQARMAFEKASLLVMVVDNQTGVTPLDQELAQLLRGTGKPFVVAVNKVDAVAQEMHAAEFHSLGARIFPIAAEQGTGVDDLLDFALEKTAAELKEPKVQDPEAVSGLHRVQMEHSMLRPYEDQDAAGVPAKQESAEEKQFTEIAIIGRPNVGKSTLLNRMAGEERSIVSPMPGTTVDSVDTDVQRGGKQYRFVDTAGIRRKGKTNLVAEKLSVVMARRGLERCDVALLIVDGEMGVTQGDAQIASYAEESGRSVIIVVNKWDLAVAAAQVAANREGATARGKARRAADRKAATEYVDKGKLMEEYEELIRKKLKFLSYAPIEFLSAKSGERAEKLFPLIDHVAAARKRKISTPELNRWLKSIDLQRGTLPKSRPIRIYYVTQAKTGPPTFLLFTNQKQPLHFAYERFLENQLRAKFDFAGTPVRWVQRLRKRDNREKCSASDDE